MHIKETYINNTENYIIGDSDFFEPYTNDIGRLFKDFLREYGRCIGKVYIDKDKVSYPIGYIFEKKVKYSDCNKYYIQHVWIKFYACKTVKGQYIHKYIDRR